MYLQASEEREAAAAAAASGVSWQIRVGDGLKKSLMMNSKYDKLVPDWVRMTMTFEKWLKWVLLHWWREWDEKCEVKSVQHIGNRCTRRWRVYFQRWNIQFQRQISHWNSCCGFAMHISTRWISMETSIYMHLHSSASESYRRHAILIPYAVGAVHR